MYDTLDAAFQCGYHGDYQSAVAYSRVYILVNDTFGLCRT